MLPNFLCPNLALHTERERESILQLADSAPIQTSPQHPALPFSAPAIFQILYLGISQMLTRFRVRASKPSQTLV